MSTHSDYNFQLTINKNIFTIILLSLVVLILLLPYVKDVLIPLGISIFITLLFEPIINRLESKRIGRVVAIIVLLVLLCGIVCFGNFYLASQINHELNSILKLINSSSINTIYSLTDSHIAETIAAKSLMVLRFLLNKTTQNSQNDISITILLIIIPIITFFLLKDGYYLKRSIMQIVSNRYFEMILDLIYKLNRKLSRWLKEQLLTVLIIGGLTSTAFYLLNIPYFLILGIITGAACLIPYYGLFIGAIISIMITFMEIGSSNLLLGMIIAFATIKLCHNLFISPLLSSHVIHLHPLIIILALLIGSYMWGLLGMLLIVPLTSVLILIGKEIYYSIKQYRL